MQKVMAWVDLKKKNCESQNNPTYAIDVAMSMPYIHGTIDIWIVQTVTWQRHSFFCAAAMQLASVTSRSAYSQMVMGDGYDFWCLTTTNQTSSNWERMVSGCFRLWISNDSLGFEVFHSLRRFSSFLVITIGQHMTFSMMFHEEPRTKHLQHGNQTSDSTKLDHLMDPILHFFWDILE